MKWVRQLFPLQVISHLQSQRSRQELLSMLYEVELRKHRDTHRLLATAEKQLTQLKEEGVKRNEVMQSQAIRRVDTPRVSIDSQDSLSNSLCALLGEGLFVCLLYFGGTSCILLFLSIFVKCRIKHLSTTLVAVVQGLYISRMGSRFHFHIFFHEWLLWTIYLSNISQIGPKLLKYKNLHVYGIRDSLNEDKNE